MSSRSERKARRNPMANAVQGFMPNQSRAQKSGMEFMYQRVLTELSLNRFKWSGLPPTVDERFLEYTLFQNALSIFYKDKNVGRYLAVMGTGLGSPNMYQNPTQFRTVGYGTATTLQAHECVPIWSNYLRIPDHDIVYLYARKLAHIDRTMEINVRSMRQTQFIQVEESQRLTIQNLMRQIDEGQPIVYGVEGSNLLDPSRLGVVNLGVDKDQVKNLQTVKSQWWNEAMTLLGINNANQEKKERMITSEAEGNKDQVTAVRSVNLKARKQAAEQINRMYGLNVSIDWDETANESAITMGVPGLEGQE